MGLNLGDKAKGVIVGLGALGVVASAGAETTNKELLNILNDTKRSVEILHGKLDSKEEQNYYQNILLGYFNELLKKEVTKETPKDEQIEYLRSLIKATEILGDRYATMSEEKMYDKPFPHIRLCKEHLKLQIGAYEIKQEKAEVNEDIKKVGQELSDLLDKYTK